MLKATAISLGLAAFMIVAPASTASAGVGASTALSTTIKVDQNTNLVEVQLSRTERRRLRTLSKKRNQRSRRLSKKDNLRSRRSSKRDNRQRRARFYRGHRGYNYQRRGYRRHNDGFWYPPAAFIVGAIIGNSIARYDDDYSDRHYNWCEDRYRSYRASDNTYQPYEGRRRQCNSPYDGV